MVEAAGPYTIHAAIVLWAIAGVILLVERRKNRKK